MSDLTAEEIVAEQAEDEGLWFMAATAPEAYLQQELRRLHAAIEAAARDRPGLAEAAKNVVRVYDSGRPGAVMLAIESLRAALDSPDEKADLIADIRRRLPILATEHPDLAAAIEHAMSAAGEGR